MLPRSLLHTACQKPRNKLRYYTLYLLSFAETLASVPESQLQTKKIPNKDNQENHKVRREQYRKAKENIEEQIKDTAFLR